MGFLVGGHRGLGCTDHEFYQTCRKIAQLPVENTLDSIRTAFDTDASYIETDAVMSADGVIFLLHNVVPQDHFFGAEKPPQFLNKMNFSDIAAFRTGRNGTGVVARLDEALVTIASRPPPQDISFCINIEIKGVQGSGQSFESNDFLATIAQVVVASGMPVERILFSSFALDNLLKMSHMLPQAQYGMLFAEKPQARPIYADRQDETSCAYLPFDKTHIDTVFEHWEKEASPKSRLAYLHPEITTITPAALEVTAHYGASINSWALFEALTPERVQLYCDVAALCQQKGIAFTAITDYLAELGRATKTPTVQVR